MSHELHVSQGKETPTLIKKKVSDGFAVLAPHLQDWIRHHLIEPRKIRCSTDPEGTIFQDLWLVTDHIGENDSASRVVFDENKRAFGLVCTLNTGVEWYMGIYGSFSDTVEAM